MRALIFALCLTALCSSSCKRKNDYVTITAPAKFEAVGESPRYAFLILSDGKKKYEINWGVESKGTRYGLGPLLFTELSEGMDYTFTLAEEKSSFNDRWYEQETSPHIVRIKRGSAVVYDRGVCEVHRRKMKRIEAPISYGMPVVPYSIHDFKTRFPHFQDYIEGGCIVQDKKTDWIYICPDCQREYARWEKEDSVRRAAASR
jgi:hypothetical protein